MFLLVPFALHRLSSRGGQYSILMQIVLWNSVVFLKTLFRVWDVFIVDGLDVLFRIALSILRINEAELLQARSVPALYVTLESLPTRMWEVDKLLRVC